MNITEFRQNHPEYDKVPDDALADSFYKQFYSGIPKEQFMSQFMPVQTKPPTPPQPVAPQPVSTLGEAAKSGIKELPSSIGREAMGAVEGAIEGGIQAVSHPIKTAEAVGKTALGGLETISPIVELTKAAGLPDTQFEQEARKQFGSIVDPLLEKYTSWDKFKETLAHNPAQFLSDALTLIPGTDISKGLETAGKVAKMIPGVEKAAKAVGELAPIKAVTELPQKAATSMYRRMIKPASNVDEADIKSAIALGLKEQIAPTDHGMKRLQKNLEVYGKEIDQTIKNLDYKGAGVKMSDLKKAFERMRVDAQNTTDPIGSRKMVDQYEKEMITGHSADIRKLNPNVIPGDEVMPLNQVQGIKKKIDQQLNAEYGKVSTFAEENKKKLRYEMKDQILKEAQKQGIDLSVAQARYSEFKNLEPMVEMAMKRLAKKEPSKLLDLIGIGVGGASGGGPGAIFGGLVSRILQDPAIHSSIIFKLNKLKTSNLAGGTAKIAAPFATGERVHKDMSQYYSK